ncbi:uncharacterized protein tasor2 [Xyrichtys novacula]|uniref:Uncharacterized protein tasor2 n=1 Tax=Xyrichtys novacula TaxID=13765 RepID=A0AAV1F698_XYRNO|nr:uncharacterized protein tasor2 [Xyrichtys novacula]
MESGNGDASSKGFLVPVPESSDAFQSDILAPLKSAYLYEESRQCFEYNSAFLVKNPALEEKYNAFRAKRGAAGYSEEDLKESFGFLLFDEANKANSLGETGVLTGNSTCTTLGDPANGIYVSMYSDCLDLNRWYHGKSGYIAIIRLTKGRVKKVSENYTQNFTVPTVGFDCHMSEQLPSVSDKTSSFLAFERTQYYMYELLDDGSNKTSQTPSAACPYAIVSFSYTDSKAARAAPQENQYFCHYFSWIGQLQIVDQFYDVRLRSTSGRLIPAKLPPVVKVDKAISMLELTRLLPRAVFETCLSGEVSQDGLWYSLCEFIPAEAEETNSLALLLCEVKEKDVALTLQLNDGGFLFLVHSSHFLTYDDTGSSAPEVLQGVFVFPDSRAIQRDTKLGLRKPAISPEILRVLPVLSYAEGEAEKTPIDPSEDLSEVLAKHMQSYAALINPGLDIIPSREVSIFADQYDVPEAHKHLYTSPEWTSKAWQSLKSYLSNPVSFQLPLVKASEILMAGQENRMEDLDDDVYICLSSPEEASASAADTLSEDRSASQTSSVNLEASVNTLVAGVDAPLDLRSVSQKVVQDDLPAGVSDKDTEKAELTLMTKIDVTRKNINPFPAASDELPAELIVSITSAERTDKSMVDVESATKQNDSKISDFSKAKSHTISMNPSNDETVKHSLDSSEVNSLKKTKRRKVRRGHYRRRKKVSNACARIHSLPTVQIPVADNNPKSQEDNPTKGLEEHQPLSNPSIADWRKGKRRKRIFGKLSPRNKKLRSRTVGPVLSEEKKTDSEQQRLESTVLMELEAFPLRRKTERWDLKPVLSECGRILVPHGSVDVADKIKSLQDELQSTKNNKSHETMSVVTSVEAQDTVETDQKSNSVPEEAVDKAENTTVTGGGGSHENAPVGHVSPEHSTFGLLDGTSNSWNMNPESSEHSPKTNVTDISPSLGIKEKQSDNPSQGKGSTKGEFLLSKLKSVLLRGKRKIDLLGSEDMTKGTIQATEPCLKMSKDDSETGVLKSNDAITRVEDSDLGLKTVSRMFSVDPLFAYALGLTPKEIPNMVQKTDSLGDQDSSQTQEQTMFDKHQIIQRPPSIFPRRGRIKTLKKHQDVSAENVKKKWWLHFQTPACYASEKHNKKECTRGYSVRKTVKEKLNSTIPSTDALTLLADLALSANHDQVPTQPDPALGRQPETSLKKCDLTKDVTSVDQESVLHALLRQPAVRPIQPAKSPSPSHLVGDHELVDLVTKEHAYSLPPSSSLPLGLPGTLSQVSPVSDSTGLLHHQKTMCKGDNGTLHPSIVQQDEGEPYRGTPEYLKKHTTHRKKFRHSRTFAAKDKSVQVTKQWKEIYDFDLDSKFASDSKDKAIIRALHGPWDHSVQDTNEEVRLIVHMWIGLFYSRSTARFFHIDPDSVFPSSEEGDSLQMSSAVVSGPEQSELKANSDAPFPGAADTSDPLTSKALDLSKKDDPALDQGSLVLDLSLKNSSAEVVTLDRQVNKVETNVSCEGKEEGRNTMSTQASNRLHEVYKELALSTKMTNGVNDFTITHKDEETCIPLHQAGQFEHTHGPSLKDVILNPIQKTNKGVSILPENCQTTGNADILQGCCKENRDMKHCTGSSKDTEINLVLSKSVMDDNNQEADSVVHTIQLDETETKDGENLEVKKKPHQGDGQELNPKPLQEGDDTTIKQSGEVGSENLDEKEEQSSSEELTTVSHDEAVSVNEDVNHCTSNESKEMEDEDRLDEKDSCVSAVDAKSDVSHQPLHGRRSDGPSSVEKDCIGVYDCQTNSDEHPPHEDKKEACHDLHLVDKCVDASEHTITGNVPHSPLKLEAGGEESVPQTNEGIESGNNKVMTSSDVGSDEHEDLHTKQIEGEQTSDNQTLKEPIISQPHSPLSEPLESKTEVMETKETELGGDEINEGLEESHNRIIIPFIGVDISREDILLPQDSDSQDTVEKFAQSQTEKTSISKTTHPNPVQLTEVSSAVQPSCKKAELFSSKASLLDVPEINQLWASGSESDERCPTPTMDEKPYGSSTCSSPHSVTSTFTGGKSSKNTTQKCLGRSSKQEPCEKSAVNGDLDSHRSLPPDLEIRTLRVLQSIDKFLSKSSPTDKSSLIKTANMKQKPQTLNSKSKYNPNCFVQSQCSQDLKDHKTNVKSAAVSAPTPQDPSIESSGNFHILPFKSKIEEVLGVGLQLKQTHPSVHQHYYERTEKSQKTTSRQENCHTHQSSPSTEYLRIINPNNDQVRHTTSQANLSYDLHPSSQRPVMAVRPSKSDESQADSLSKDRQNENLELSNKLTKTLSVSSTLKTMPLEIKMQCFERHSEALNDNTQETSMHLSRSRWSSHVSDSRSNKAKFAHQDPLYQHEGRDSSKLSKTSAFLPVQSSGSNSSSQLVEGKQCLTYSPVEKAGQIARESLEIDPRNCSEVSTSLVDYKDDDNADDDLYLGPDSSLSCTVYNTSRKRSYSFLEQVSRRCIQDDRTEASMEQECLIFSEKMKQLLKRSKMGSVHKMDAHGKSNTSFSSPVLVRFSDLEEREELKDHLDELSIFGQKIKVDMSDRKDLVNTTEKTLHSEKSSQGTSVEHAGISAVTAEYAELYEAAMDDVCAIRDAPSRPKHLRMDRGYLKAEPSNYFDFCDQMKREMDESFRSTLNSVVKKSCKTKYRFYILETSDNPFFEETKALLGAEGHTAVQPSEFFLSDGGPSSLLIILRNEDIAEHICEVPHLLELKKSPAVQFAGIDEPDDVVNLTHQELFTRGGLIMFDKALLEPLSLCDMTKMSEILQELSKTGKWKWMLHYRDSRRLKENARLSAVAKKKKQFLLWGQESGMLEVLPYHECDLMSRDDPDYLTCLVRLQVQNITARYTVFITDSASDSAFERNGIITTSLSSFLLCSPSETFSV